MSVTFIFVRTLRKTKTFIFSCALMCVLSLVPLKVLKLIVTGSVMQPLFDWYDTATQAVSSFTTEAFQYEHSNNNWTTLNMLLLAHLLSHTFRKPLSVWVKSLSSRCNKTSWVKTMQRSVSERPNTQTNSSSALTSEDVLSHKGHLSQEPRKRLLQNEN